MQITKRLHHLTVATGIAFVLLAGSAMAQSVPTSEHNARWPREPVGGPLPAASPAPAPVPEESNDWTLVSVAAGFVLIAVVTAGAAGVRVRLRRRVVA
jgi:hypothetical protein